MSDSDYLTLARIMKAELAKWQQRDNRFKNMTGFEQIVSDTAFQAGFMAGFEGRYFHEGD